MPYSRPALTPNPPKKPERSAKRDAGSLQPVVPTLNPTVAIAGAHCFTPQVLSDERTRRDYDEGSDVVLQGRDEAGGLREQVGLAIHPHPNAR